MNNKLDLVKIEDTNFCDHFEDIDYTGSIMLENGYFVNYLKINESDASGHLEFLCLLFLQLFLDPYYAHDIQSAFIFLY